jgi:hypothetical protein
MPLKFPLEFTTHTKKLENISIPILKNYYDKIIRNGPKYFGFFVGTYTIN